jgi:hypothetical protein
MQGPSQFLVYLIETMVCSYIIVWYTIFSHMAKYQKHFQKMLEEYQDFFNEFKVLHDNYAQDPDEYRDAYSTMGQKILRIIRRYDNELCSKSENSGYGKFSSNLSDKFWEQVRAYFPKIDEVALE